MRQSSRHDLLPAENGTPLPIAPQRLWAARISSAVLVLIAISAGGCHSIIDKKADVRPLALHDTPAQRLAFRFAPDTPLPADVKVEELNSKLPAIQNDFITNRKNDALLRTVVSPDGQRGLALYGSGDQPNPDAFRIDLYSSDGKFLRNLSPPDLSCAFPFYESVAWSPDGNFITFIARRNVKPKESPNAVDEIDPLLATASPTPVAAPAPAFAPVPTFNTEQIYICDRDGYQLKPLTSREGLIYFNLSWAPDNHALAALACKEDEWNARDKAHKLPTGRPRLITPEGKERLLDDQSTEAWPVWSPDSSKIATAFETDVGIYDAATAKPTQARIPLREDLITASRAYEEHLNKTADQSGKSESQPPPGTQEVLASFNPIVKLEWAAPDKLYIQTAFIQLGWLEAFTFPRWHLLFLSPQAATLK